MEIVVELKAVKSETDALQTMLDTEQNPSLAQRQLLARYLVRQKRWKEASSAVSQALKMDEASLAMLLVSAEVRCAGAAGKLSIHEVV